MSEFILHNGPVSVTFNEPTMFWHAWLSALRTIEIDRKVLCQPYPRLWVETKKGEK